MVGRKLLAAGGAALGLLLGGGSAAFAAGGGYGPPPAAPGGTGAFSQVCLVQTVDPSGGTVTGTVGAATVTVTVPPGDFTAPVQVVISCGNTSQISLGVSGLSVFLAFAVQIDQNGQKLPGPFSTPISVSVSDSAITPQTKVFQQSGTSFVPAAGWTTGTGTASGSFALDPSYVFANPTAAPSTIPSATLAVTGKPFRGEALLALGLVGVGGFGIWRFRRRRPQVAG